MEELEPGRGIWGPRSRPKVLCLVSLMLALNRLADAQSPTLSISLVPPSTARLSWPSSSASWQLIFTTNLFSVDWQPVPQTPVPSGDRLVVSYPITNASSFFRLKPIGGGGCVFQATPAVITAGASSTLTWCPVVGTTYTLSPGGTSVSGGSVTVSPTITTVYTLTATSASGVESSTTAVIVDPCGWLHVTNWDATLDFSYSLAPSTPDYNFSLNHQGHVTFHLVQQAGSTPTDVNYFGFAPGGTASLNDREDDKTVPSHTFTTTENGSGLPLSVSSLSLHVTCTNYDFSYNVVIDATTVTDFGTSSGEDGSGTGAIASRPIHVVGDTISDSDQVPAEYPPLGGDFFVPSSHVGQSMFNTGTVNNSTGGKASVSWSFTPVPD